MNHQKLKYQQKKAKTMCLFDVNAIMRDRGCAFAVVSGGEIPLKSETRNEGGHI